MEFALFKPIFNNEFNTTLNFGAGSESCRLSSSAMQIVKRIQHLVEAHRLNEGQLLRLIPESWNWNLGTIGNPDLLASALSAEQIAWFAETFHVELDWLEGHGEWAAIPFSGYKQIEWLAANFRECGWMTDKLRMTILARDYTGRQAPLGTYAIVFSSPLQQDREGQPQLYRHRLFESQWAWDHWPCRRDTKAVARWFAKHLHTDHTGRIPIVPISSRDFTRVTSLEIPPSEFVPDNPVGYEGFEDRVLRPLSWPNGESHVATESEELSLILQHLEASGFLTAASQNTNAVRNLN